MGRYIIRRLLGVIMLLFIVSIVTFGIFFLIPSDPAVLYSGRTSDAATIEQTRIKLGLDKPVYEQYGQYVKGIFVGRDYVTGADVTHCPAPCLGYSFKTEQAVWPLLLDPLGGTIFLAIGAGILWLGTGILIGILSALRKGSIFDRG